MRMSILNTATTEQMGCIIFFFFRLLPNLRIRVCQQQHLDVYKRQGIIYIDEIDKITRKSENTSITRDVSGE